MMDDMIGWKDDGDGKQYKMLIYTNLLLLFFFYESATVKQGTAIYLLQ